MTDLLPPEKPSEPVQESMGSDMPIPAQENENLGPALQENKLDPAPEASPTQKDPAVQDLSGLMEKLDALSTAMLELNRDFDIKLKYDANKEHVIDSLLGELKDYREDLYVKMLRPAVMDLIEMHDDLGRLLISSIPAETASGTEKQMYRNLCSFLDSIEFLLEKLGVQAFVLPDNEFVRGKQKIQRMVNTADPVQDGKVAEHLRKGFESGDKVIRPEVISLYKYVSMAQPI